MGITITDVKTITLKAPIAQQVKMSFGSMQYRPGMIVQVFTNKGIIGIGETWVNYPFWASDERKATIEKGIKPLLINENPLNVSKLYRKMYQNLNRLGLQWGATGPVMQAISGIEIALWDIAGKYYAKPVYELLGGAFEKGFKIYGSGLGPHKPEETAAKCVQQGIKAVKLKVGFGEKVDLRNAQAVREAIGRDGTFMVDANMGWTPQEAIRMINKLEQFGIEFVEEPVSHDNLEGLATISSSVLTPVAAGENVYTRYGFKQILAKNAVSIVQPDITKTGGILESKVICEMADAWGLKWAPHFFGNAVGLAATLHLFAATPGGMFVEYDATENPLRDKILKKPFTINNGYIEVPSGPGLGIELDEEAIKRYSA